MRSPIITLRPREELRIKAGHPWVYDNEIASTGGEPRPGDSVRVNDSKGRTHGFGFFNPNSKIRVRIFSRTRQEADRSFFIQAFQDALAWRRRFFDTENLSFRAVFGEADSVPGLVVDLFRGGESSSGRTGTWLSCQFLSLGLESRREEIVAALREVFEPDGIRERSDAPVRALEGLEARSGVLWGSVPGSFIMNENGSSFSIDLSEGQKTGWFLDQRANRAAASRLAAGRSVLDAFCNQGGFGIQAARAGAREVLAVDSSSDALAAAARNAALNGFSDRFTTVEANAFDYLRELEREGKRFGMIILDPPAFAKSRHAVEPAHRGYREINVRAMRILEREGILVTCSCSHWFDEGRFDSMLEEAAADCGRRFRIIEQRSQDLDHPVISGYPESRYLKCRILQLG